MPLSTNFSDTEVEYVREICHISNKSDFIASLAQKLDALNAAQVTATQRDISKWEAIEYGTERSKGGIKGTDYSTERNRDQITNKVRERLGYDPLPSTSGTDNSLGILSVGFPSWIGGCSTDEYSNS